MLGVLEPDVERVYRAVLSAPRSGAAVLAGDLRLPVATVDDALAALVTAGLVLDAPDGTYSAAPVPSPLDRQILALLLTGLTDQAVAAQLGISLRTVQRRVRRLEDLAGVRTRMQLGWYAARNGWG